MKKGVIIHINMFSVRSFIEAKFRNKHENITEIIKLILAACVGALAEKIIDLLFWKQFGYYHSKQKAYNKLKRVCIFEYIEYLHGGKVTIFSWESEWNYRV